MTFLSAGRATTGWTAAPDDDTLAGGAGDDRLDGGEGVDTADYFDPDVESGVSVNLDTGRAFGDDTGYDKISNVENVVGSNQDDTLTGDDGANDIQGRGGNDDICGRGGNDILNGGVGDDDLWGGEGADTFVFSTADGHDIIHDFANGEDMIDLTGFKLDGLGDVTATQEGDNVHLDLRAANPDFLGGTILLKNFDLADLDAGDFLF